MGRKKTEQSGGFPVVGEEVWVQSLGAWRRARVVSLGSTRFVCRYRISEGREKEVAIQRGGWTRERPQVGAKIDLTPAPEAETATPEAKVEPAYTDTNGVSLQPGDPVFVLQCRNPMAPDHDVPGTTGVVEDFRWSDKHGALVQVREIDTRNVRHITIARIRIMGKIMGRMKKYLNERAVARGEHPQTAMEALLEDLRQRRRQAKREDAPAPPERAPVHGKAKTKRVAKTKKTTGVCLCGCGAPVNSLFLPGHDARMKSAISRLMQNKIKDGDERRRVTEAAREARRAMQELGAMSPFFEKLFADWDAAGGPK